MTPERLKASILQAAIQGKLVEQIVGEQCPDLSKLKKKKTEEIEFELPDTWQFAHLESISVSVASKQFQIAAAEFKTAGKYPVISQSKEYIIGYSDNDKMLYHHDNPVIVFGDHTTIVKYVDFDFVVGADGVKIFSPNANIITAKFFGYVMEYYSTGLEKVGGYSRHYKFIKDKPFPIPPIEEQQRIVAKIEELIPLVEQYSRHYEKLEQFNAKFPEEMKKSILQYAIHGKLVEQRPEEGTAEELYQQIQEEKQKLIKAGKIKKEKSLTAIKDDEIPYDIPESWKWVKLGDVVSLLSGSDFPPSKYNDKGEGMPYMTGASNIVADQLIINRWTPTPNNISHLNDLLLVCKGSGYGKTVINTIGDVHIARQFMSFQYGLPISYKYLGFYLQSQIGTIKQNGQGVIPGIDRTFVLNMLLPLPPQKEQQRIVKKIEELLPYCDRLIR